MCKVLFKDQYTSGYAKKIAGSYLTDYLTDSKDQIGVDDPTGQMTKVVRMTQLPHITKLVQMAQLPQITKLSQIIKLT